MYNLKSQVRLITILNPDTTQVMEASTRTNDCTPEMIPELQTLKKDIVDLVVYSFDNGAANFATSETFMAVV